MSGKNVIFYNFSLLENVIAVCPLQKFVKITYKMYDQGMT